MGIENKRYSCLHCGKKNPQHLSYREEGNACSKCAKEINYYVVYNWFKDYTIKITIGLTKKGAEDFLGNNKKRLKKVRIVTFKQFGKIEIQDEINLFKRAIQDNKRDLIRYKYKLKIKEIELKIYTDNNMLNH